VNPTRESLDPAEFDRFRDSYESELNRVVAWAGQDADVYSRVKADALLELARRHVGEPAQLRFLDVGCGIGSTDRHLVGHVGALTGVDISEAMIDRARATNPGVSYRTYDGSRLPFEDRSLDVVFAVCVMHHVPPSSWPRLVSELTRVTRTGGIVAIAEHNPYNPVTRAIVNRCAFDADAVLLSQKTSRRLLTAAGLLPIETRNILFVPWRNPFVVRAESALRRVPLGAQYVSVGLRTG
jgi:SAM-dependent methyltransferase